MSEDLAERISLRRYLLGEISDEAELRRIEERLLVDDDFQEELAMEEEELIDRYIFDELSAGESARFREHFLCHPEREARLELAQRLKVYATEQRRSEPARPRTEITSSPRIAPWFRTIPLSLKIAASILLAIGLGLFIWKVAFRQSDVDRSLVALNAAYRDQRPVEARISNFNYAPYLTTRGAGSEKVDQNELRRAELTLLDARSPTPRVYHALGKVYLAQRDFDKAIEQFDEALKGDSKNAQIYSDLGAAYLEKGKIDLEKGKTEPASSEAGKGMEELGRSLENLKRAIELNANLLEALFNRALCRQYLMLPQQAEEDWHEYLKRDSTSAWAEEARRNLQRLEERKNQRSQTKENLLQDFLSAHESKNDNAAWASLSRSRGRTGNLIVQTLLDEYLSLSASGDLKEAEARIGLISYAGKVEAEKVRDRFTLDIVSRYGSLTNIERANLSKARSQMKSATGLYNNAEWQRAIEVFSQARETFAQTRDEPETLFAEAWIGYSYLRIPDPQEGTETFERLSKSFESRNYKSLFAQSLLAQADALSSQNEYSKILKLTNHALAVSEQIEDDANAVRCLQAATSIYISFGNYGESLNSAFRALTLANALPPDPKIVWPLYHEASVDFYSLGLYMTAVQFEEESLRVATDGGLPFHASRSYDRLSLFSERLHHYSEAITYNQQARAVGQKIADDKTRTNIFAHSALILGDSYRESGNPQRAIASYDEALDLYGKLNLDVYQYRAHKGKLIALMALNDNASAESELATTLYWFEQIREKIAEESFRNSFFDAGQETYDIAVDFAYSRKGDAAKAFDYAEASRARSLLDLITKGARVAEESDKPDLKLSSASSALTLSQIQSRLPAEAQLLEYAILDDKVVIWVVTRESLESGICGVNRTDFNQKIRNYLAALSHGNTGEITAESKELYACLITPVESHLDRRRQLTIVPADDLSFIPFAALISPSSGRYLVEDYALETAPSATIFVASSEQAKQKEKINPEHPLVVGGPNFDRERFANFSDLPEARREAEEIAALYGTMPLLGESAAVGRVRRFLKEANVVHLATHAVADERSPLLSKLLFSPDRDSKQTHHAGGGFLQASDIYHMSLPQTRLVVLSACQTGIERSYRGEGAIGLARPFLVAGVPVVVASLWSVDSETTANFMISFHRNRMQKHVSTIDALRETQLEFLHNTQLVPSKNFDWAAFIAIGGFANF